MRKQSFKSSFMLVRRPKKREFRKSFGRITLKQTVITYSQKHRRIENCFYRRRSRINGWRNPLVWTIYVSALEDREGIQPVSISQPKVGRALDAVDKRPFQHTNISESHQLYQGKSPGPTSECFWIDMRLQYFWDIEKDYELFHRKNKIIRHHSSVNKWSSRDNAHIFWRLCICATTWTNRKG